ncbi:DUF6695 family protein [Kordia algicida OT-1]|uniref:Uncharacterized protein n=1 Tax=Kordia algicida OT-1 TaxID=391587 RepID=A9E250_9FLAO|nr:DUF6695 family protein [Kordia algicida]EDP95528.1 hypothetical protein KAOT1_21791 [Kordia algicida OT-1]
MNNSGIILTLAYPDTIVRTAEEWYSPFLRFIGIGKKHYIRAGHAALVLIDKTTGNLDYYDYGRYVTKLSYGRVRSKVRDRELDFPLQAIIRNGEIVNLKEILHFLGNHPALTHGEGRMIASVCDQVDYEVAQNYIEYCLRQGSTTYAAFLKNASNCARFVTDTLIASVTNSKIRKQLKKSTWFTPSTVGNVMLANTTKHVYEVVGDKVNIFDSTSRKETMRCFLDRLKNHEPNLLGNIEPKKLDVLSENAQWLSGIGSGVWFEIEALPAMIYCYRIRRISPYGTVDVDGIFKVNNPEFDVQQPYEFIYDSNCAYCNILQNNVVYYFSFQEDYTLSIA